VATNVEQEPAPEGSMEETVAQLCAAVSPNGAGIPAPDVVLADLGFDSLVCADLALALEERFGVRLADADMPELRTVADVAAAVRRKARAMARVPPGLGRMQRRVTVAAGWAFRWQARLRVDGAEHVPRTGPAILAANHRSMLDIPLLVLACPRLPVLFMAKQELFGDPLRRRLWLELGGFAVRRDIADIRAIDIGLGILERGDLLGLYPEGTRSKTGDLLPFLNGAAWMALRTGAPVVPCAIRGTEREPGGRRTLRKRVRVRFGPAIAVEREPNNARRRERSAEVTGRLLGDIARLLA
jgi:1-acyl-sn-glycerol-3-phosphate acyltransferase